MKLLIAYAYYYAGDLLSHLLRFNCFSFLYKAYNYLMIKSCDLDVDKKIWQDYEDCEHLNE